MPSKELNLAMQDPEYRKAWLAGYRQALEDLDQATKQILARKIVGVNDVQAEA